MDSNPQGMVIRHWGTGKWIESPLTAVLLIILLQILGSNASGIALFGSLLWLAHPIQAQAVTYTVQRASRAGPG